MASLVSNVTESGLINLRARVRQAIWPMCGRMFAELGFVSSLPGFFAKRSTAQIDFGILVDVEKTRGSVQVGTSLMIFHDAAARLVSEGLRVKGIGSDEASTLALDVRSLQYLMKRAGLPRPLTGYPIFEESQADRVATSIVEGVPLVAEGYFSNGGSESRLIAYFESDKTAGGTSNQINLMSLYFVTGRVDKLRDFLAGLSPHESSPMTVAFKEYLLEQITRAKPSGN